jgi:murein DD-endopeptidase MepM/ murein hydrolase activator NlpD
VRFAAALITLAALAGCMQASPPGSAVTPVATSSHSESVTATALPAPSPKPAVTSAAIAPQAGAKAAESAVIVKPGDTIYSVARANGVAIRDLIQWNGLDAPYDLKPGAALRLPPRREHVVAAGDTVYSISRRYGADMTALTRMNGIAPPYNIAVGRTLQIPPPSMAALSPMAPQYAAVQGAAASPAAQSAPQVAAQGSAAPQASAAASPPSTGATVESVPLAPLPPAPTAPTSAPASASAAASTPAAASVPKPSPQASAAPAATESAPSLPEPAAKPQSAPSQASVQSAAAPPPIAPIAPEPKPGVETAALTAPSAPIAGGAFQWPLQGKIISPYGAKKGGEHNDGVNIEAAKGEAVRAAADGTVIYAGNELRGFGNLILLKHDGGWTTAYAHNDQLLVERGAMVKRGQIIAKAGSTGNVASPQLHFEIRRGTRAVNPVDYLAGGPESASVSRASAPAVPPDLE